MPELRTDWLTGRSVIVAEKRAHRPNQFSAAAAAGTVGIAAAPFDCPFCVGNESQTPPAICQHLDALGRWQLRVVPNMFPAVEAGEAAPPGGQGGSARPAIGAHEVIIESARHVDRMSALTVLELRRALATYADRLGHWHDEGHWLYGLVFKNQGSQAGASLAHVHSQLIALPEIPPAVAREHERADAAYGQQGHCPYCRLLEQERQGGERIVLDRDGFVAFCPFASLQPLEVWLMPADHEPWFERLDRGDALDRLAGVLHGLVGKLEALIPGAACNWFLRTAPWHAEAAPWFHWRIELLPRVAPLAGLEIAAGVHINSVPPEQAAGLLRTGD